MYFHSPAVLLAASVLASAVSGTPLHTVQPIPRKDVEVVGPRNLRARSSSLMKRDANATFDLGFQVQDQVLFDGPSLNLNVPLKLVCNDCRTWGTVEAVTFVPDDIGEFFEDLTDFDLFNNANMSIIFNGVGAFVDLSVVASQQGSFTLPLFASQTPLGVAGPNFQLGVVFFVDLALGFTGEVEANSGFQLTIPDGSAFTMSLDPAVGSTADFDGTMFSLLPLTVEAPVNVTVALRLRVQAGLEFVGSPLLSAQALAGATLNIPEVLLGAALSLGGNATCALPAFAEVNINAGVFVDVGADVGLIEIGDFNPTLSTTFFEAAVSTCFDDLLGGGGGGGGATATATPGLPFPNATATITSAPAVACPTDLVTETTTTVSTVALTSCALPVVNCPANLTQVIVAEQTATITLSSCPVAVTELPPSHANATTVVVTVSTTVCPQAAPTAAPAGAVMLTKLPTPITSQLVVYPAVAPPAEHTVTGVVSGGEVKSAGMVNVTAPATVTAYGTGWSPP